MANPPLLGHLQTRLRKTLKDSSIILGEIDKGVSNYSIISCLGHEYYLDEENNHNVGLFPFRVADKYDYWLSSSIEFNSFSKKIAHISIVFYDSEKHKMFRAEWANNLSQTVHAQPHWHIHSRKLDLSSPVWNEEVIQNFPEEYEEVVSDKTKNIHFAMSSHWYNEFNHVQSLNDCNDSDILNWIENVLKYVNQQLTYLHDKRKV